MSNAWVILAAMLASMPQREPQERQPYKSTLTKAQQKKRAKKNRIQKASRKNNNKKAK